MPSKTNSIAKAAQARNKQQKARLRELEQHRKEVLKIIAQDKRQRDRELVQTLKAVKGKGIYEPKSFELTKYRKAQARKVKREYGDFLNLKKFFFIKPEKADKAHVVERGENLGFKTTKAGLFIPKEGHTKASIKRDKKRGEYYIDRQGKTKKGVRKGAYYHTIMPLASLDELDAERDRIAHLATQLGPLKKGEYLAFKVNEYGMEGYSHQTFGNIELLFGKLEEYKKSIPERLQFLRHIEIVKTTATAWHKAHGPAAREQKRKVLANGRNA